MKYWIAHFRSLAVALALLLPASCLASSARAQTPSSPDVTLFGECPQENVDISAKLTNYSLYYENYKNEAYDYALENLRWMLKCAPTFAGEGQNDDRNLDRAVESYDALAEQATDEALAESYLDSALIIIEKALPILEANVALDENDRYEWTFKKGYFIQSHSDVLTGRTDEIVGAYAAAYAIAPDDVGAYYLGYMLRHYAAMRDFGPLMQLLRDIEQNYADDTEKLALVEQYMEAIPPRERLAFIERRLEVDPDNLDLIKRAFRIYEQMDNRARLYELGERLSEMDPSPEIARMLGTMYLGDGRSSEALEMYNEMLDMPGATATAMDYYNMGIANRQLGRLASARTYFRQTLDADPEFGRAYLAIGDLYVTAVSNCGSIEREDRAVYWLAADYYQRAKSADPSVAATANQRLNTYRGQFPSTEDMFFWGKSDGDSYAVNYGCYSWINETTTVRG